MLTGIKKHCLCHRCNNLISVFKYTFRNKVFCWNCGNSKNRNDRTKTPYGKLQWHSFAGCKQPTRRDLKELTYSTRLEF